MRPIEFVVQTPGERTDIEARIRRNDQMGMREALAPKAVIIVSSGPSAKDPELWDRIRHETAPTVAVNGALKLFMDQGLAPTYWACCDPQELVNDFIPDDPPEHTVYLIAKKCPESLFARLQDRDVRAWHIDDYPLGETRFCRLTVPSAVSITLVTQSLFRMIGYNRFEHYGWDCCFVGDEHHAVPQADVGDKITFTIEQEEELIRGWDETGFNYTHRDAAPIAEFLTTGSWLAELNDACIQAHNLQAMGYVLKVHGPGAVGALLRARRLIS